MLLHSEFSLISHATWPYSEKSWLHPQGRGCLRGKIFATMSEKVEFWPTDPILRVGGGGLGGQNICYHVAALVILFNLICNMTLFWKSWILSYLPHPQGRGWSAGKIFVTMLLHAFVILFNLIYNMTVFWKSWMLTYWPHQHGLGVAAGKIFATILLQSWFSLIWNAKWPCSEKVEFWPTDPIPRIRGGGGLFSGKIFATMLLHSEFSLIWHATWPYSEKYWLHP